MNAQTPSTSTTPTQNASGGALRAFLWCVLVLGAVGNMVASAADASVTVLVVLGAVTAAALAGLVYLWAKARA
jgi:hypothetical protein